MTHAPDDVTAFPTQLLTAMQEPDLDEHDIAVLQRRQQLLQQRHQRLISNGPVIFTYSSSQGAQVIGAQCCSQPQGSAPLLCASHNRQYQMQFALLHASMT